MSVGGYIASVQCKYVDIDCVQCKCEAIVITMSCS